MFGQAWELVRKLALTGFVLLIDNSRNMQRQFVAMMLSCLSCVVLIGRRPYQASSDNALAIGAQVTLFAAFSAAFVIQICEASAEMCSSAGFGSTDEVASVFVIGLAFMLLAVLVCISFDINRSTTLLAIRVVATGREPELTLRHSHQFHLFLSRKKTSVAPSCLSTPFFAEPKPTTTAHTPSLL